MPMSFPAAAAGGGGHPTPQGAFPPACTSHPFPTFVMQGGVPGQTSPPFPAPAGYPGMPFFTGNAQMYPAFYPSPPNAGVGDGGEKRSCVYCGSTRHWVADCNKLKEKKEKEAATAAAEAKAAAAASAAGQGAPAAMQSHQSAGSNREPPSRAPSTPAQAELRPRKETALHQIETSSALSTLAQSPVSATGVSRQEGRVRSTHDRNVGGADAPPSFSQHSGPPGCHLRLSADSCDANIRGSPDNHVRDPRLSLAACGRPECSV